MSDVSFDVKVYMQHSDWEAGTPSDYFSGFLDRKDAVEEAELWPEAYQVVVVKRGDDGDNEPGEYVYELKALAA